MPTNEELETMIMELEKRIYALEHPEPRMLTVVLEPPSLRDIIEDFPPFYPTIEDNF